MHRLFPMAPLALLAGALIYSNTNGFEYWWFMTTGQGPNDYWWTVATWAFLIFNSLLCCFKTVATDGRIDISYRILTFLSTVVYAAAIVNYCIRYGALLTNASFGTLIVPFVLAVVASIFVFLDPAS